MAKSKNSGEEPYKKSGDIYPSFFDNMLNGFAYCKILFVDGKADDFVYLEVNDVYKKITGLKEPVGAKASDLIPGIKETDNELLEILGRVSLSGESEKFEYHLKVLGKWLSISAFSTESGYFITVIDEITDRKFAEEELKLAKEEADAINANVTAIIEGTDESIWAFDRNFDILYINNVFRKEFLATFGVQLEPGVNLVDSLPESLRPIWRPRYERVLSNERFNVEDVIDTDDGKIYIHITFNPIVKKGSVVGGSCIGSNITNRKLEELELIRAKEIAEESEYFLRESQKVGNIGSYKTDFISGIWKSSQTLDIIFGIDESYDRSISGWMGLVHKADMEMMSSYLTDEVIGNKKPFNKEYRIVRKNDNQTRWVFGQGMIGTDNNGKVVSLIGTIQDITERKLDEYKIRKLDKAVEASSEVIFITDTEGIYTYVNPSFTKIYGYKAKDVIGKVTPRILKSGLMDPASYVHFWHELLNNRVVNEELINKTKDGRNIQIESSSNAILNEANEIIGFIAIQKDITTRKQIEDELVFAKEKAEESDRLKSAFLANMSHEIRTPMNGILGFSSLLSDRGLKVEEQKEYVKIIEKSGARLLTIIDEIMDISKIESRQMEIEYSETNVNELIEQVYSLLSPDAADKGLVLSLINNTPSEDAFVSTDSEKLYSILTNLVKNAIKYTDKGSVEIGYDKKGSFLEFFVKDTGIGIPKDRQEAIFERFIQADIANIQARQGAGLGLSIAKAFVEMLGGNIWVDSKDGIGTIFYFTLPNKEVLEITEPTEKDEPYDKTDSKVGKLKVLIADDDEVSIKLISIALEEVYMELLSAKTGREAIDVSRNNSDIDLILMDIQMPDLNGFEATRKIRQFNKDVVIIAQTAFAMTGDREKAIDSGCDDYIAKPIIKDNLLELLNRYFKS